MEMLYDNGSVCMTTNPSFVCEPLFRTYMQKYVCIMMKDSDHVKYGQFQRKTTRELQLNQTHQEYHKKQEKI